MNTHILALFQAVLAFITIFLLLIFPSFLYLLLLLFCYHLVLCFVSSQVMKDVLKGRAAGGENAPTGQNEGEISSLGEGQVKVGSILWKQNKMCGINFILK